MSVLRILEDIDADTKRTYKIDVIKQNFSNEQFKTVLKLALDPYINFYIRKIPDYVPTGKKTLDWALVELKGLSDRQFTGHAGIEHLRGILNSLSADDATVVERIIGKDLRCGAGDGTVNKVSKGYIPSYPCLLARPYDSKNIQNITYSAISQLKADGLRVNFHVNGTKVTICGRSGRDIDLLGYMDTDIAELGAQYATPHVFDGELVVIDENGKILPRKVGNGIINKAIKGTITPEEAKMVRAQLWDAIPLVEFQAGVSKETYDKRFDTLVAAIEAVKPKGMDALVAKLRNQVAKFWVIPYRYVANLDEAQEHFQEMLGAGEEGTILKNLCGLWEDTRSKHLVKFKSEKDCDLEIIGWNPGQGKFEGMVGSIIAASSDRKVEVSISGFSDDLRAEITRTINQLIGTIMAVTYNERIGSKALNRDGIDSLFLPRFAEFRTDKTVANSSKEIL
jgi:hypothetical protein